MATDKSDMLLTTNFETTDVSTEIVDHVIVDDKNVHKNRTSEKNEEPTESMQDKLFSITKEQLKHNSLAELICPVSDYKFFNLFK